MFLFGGKLTVNIGVGGKINIEKFFFTLRQ